MTSSLAQALRPVFSRSPVFLFPLHQVTSGKESHMSNQNLPSEFLCVLPLDGLTLYTRDLRQYPDLPMARKLELEQLVR